MATQAPMVGAHIMHKNVHDVISIVPLQESRKLHMSKAYISVLPVASG